MREQLDLHRANAICASCHARMDPIGFALENYDAVGKFRTREGGAEIDAWVRAEIDQAYQAALADPYPLPAQIE